MEYQAWGCCGGGSIVSTTVPEPVLEHHGAGYHPLFVISALGGFGGFFWSPGWVGCVGCSADGFGCVGCVGCVGSVAPSSDSGVGCDSTATNCTRTFSIKP